jgi:hypothetical protein
LLTDCFADASDDRQTCSRSNRAQTRGGFKTTKNRRAFADPPEGHFLLRQCQVHRFSVSSFVNLCNPLRIMGTQAQPPLRQNRCLQAALVSLGRATGSEAGQSETDEFRSLRCQRCSRELVVFPVSAPSVKSHQHQDSDF